MPVSDEVRCAADGLYNYFDEAGKLIYQCEWVQPGAVSPSGWRLRRPEGNGWSYITDGLRLVPYRLRDLQSARGDIVVCVCNYEREVEELVRQMQVATCVPGGLSGWRDVDHYFKDRYVEIYPRNDEDSHRRAQQIADSLRGIVADVQVVLLPDLKDGQGVCDWFADGHSIEELLPDCSSPPAELQAAPNGQLDSLDATTAGASTDTRGPDDAAAVGPRPAKQRRNPAALVMPVAEFLFRCHSKGSRIAEAESGERVLVDHLGIVIAEVQPKAPLGEADELVARGAGLLSSLAAHRLVRWLVQEGHRRVVEDQVDARKLTFTGGWSGLAKTIGANGHKAADQVHAIVAALARLRFPGIGAYYDLLTYTARPATRSRPASITISLGDPLLPQFGFALRTGGGTSRSQREAQRLVPITALPPLVGRERDSGAIATMSLGVLIELRKRARQIFEEGGALLELTTLQELADTAGLPAGLLDRVLERWTQDGDDGPAFLTQVDSQRYMLGPARETAHRFLIDAGRRESKGKKGGRRSAARRKLARHYRRRNDDS